MYLYAQITYYTSYIPTYIVATLQAKQQNMLV